MDAQTPYTVISAEVLVDLNGVTDIEKFIKSIPGPWPTKLHVEHVVGDDALASKVYELNKAGLSAVVLKGRAPVLDVDITVVPKVNIRPQIGGTNG